MFRAILSIITLALAAAPGTRAAEPRTDNALLAAARKALPQGISTGTMARALQGGLWKADRKAVAISLARPKGSVIFVFLRQPNGTYLAVDASGVEGGNFGKLGRGRGDYERFATKPVQWLSRDDGLFQVVMRTRAWRAGRRYTVSEPLVIKPDGTVLWR
jgi:hypothetical protein